MKEEKKVEELADDLTEEIRPPCPQADGLWRYGVQQITTA
jgi:hypothetical protein